ncbi:Ppx/GppA phosphatase family protein [Solibacillus sp. FSL H8-0538]|uniref:Ppx/GppA phosphatase family protein n=1 Tax=Solibacillus sp. FSL H8-0538 TaxID=2921400 RepID=UPI0030F95EAB
MKKINTAIIDIGSNTIRLVFYEYDKNEGLHEFGNIKTVARLRTHILPNGEMAEEGIQLLLKTLSSFKQILADYNVTDIKAVATAAVRQAINNEAIITRMIQETGIAIDILSEEEEAYFGFIAVAHSMDTPSAVTIDIGGGSTEITLFKNKKLQKTISFPFGTVSLKQKFVQGHIINEQERLALQNYVKEGFKSLSWIENVKLPIIAIGGSARNVAQIHQQKVDYPLSGVHQYEMTRNDIIQLKEELAKMPFEQLKQLDGLSSDRADIIVPALEVFSSLMEVVGTQSFQLSKKGLREGLIISRILHEDVKAFDKYNVFEDNARRLAFEYGRSEEEVNMLNNLSEQFYRECCHVELLEYNEEHLQLIKKASKVFAIGEYIELDSSSQHTFYLLANQSIVGMNHEDRVKLALLASYKNRDYFRRFAAPFETWFTKEELKQIRDFGALLKFVYALNVSKRNIVSKITVELIDDIIHVVVTTSERAIAEAYQVERQKKHIERVFKRSVIIHFNEEGWK